MSGQHRWILTATDYFTIWVEAYPCRVSTHNEVIRCLEEIMSRFGVPRKVVTDNAKYFKAKPLILFCQDNGIELTYSTAYYPQGNGLAESSNKSLVRIIKKLLQEHKRA